MLRLSRLASQRLRLLVTHRLPIQLSALSLAVRGQNRRPLYDSNRPFYDSSHKPQSQPVDMVPAAESCRHICEL